MRRRYLCGAFMGVLVIAAAISATAGGATPSMHHGRMHRITNSTSSNWSGYAVTGSRFTSVSASWTQPTAKCSGTAYSSFWVGLDGDTSNTVEQTGTDADCSGSTPQYYAWYEMYPKFPVNLSGTVRPGDHLSASVTTNGIRQVHADDHGQHPGVDEHDEREAEVGEARVGGGDRRGSVQ